MRGLGARVCALLNPAFARLARTSQFDTGMSLIHVLRILIVLFVHTLLSQYAIAQGSAYAVFKVSYNETGGEVVGGVAGSAFFVAPNRAVSAHHVLNATSFRPAEGFAKTRVWLVHEGETPIELFAPNVRTDSSKDITLIAFASPVSAKVFTRAPASLRIGEPVASEGFRANSAGPLLFWNGPELEISSVPRLERLRAEGVLLRATAVSVQADDLQVRDARGMQVSYAPVVGMSGGPVLQNGMIVGFNSFANPDRATSWALALP